MSVIAVRNANQMMISADIRDDGIFVSYADGKSGVVPFGEIKGIVGRDSIERLELPNPYEVVLAMADGSHEELPWDFVRWHCDESFGARTEATIQRGQQAVGSRIRSHRQANGFTQVSLAAKAGIGRVTLTRIEKGGQAPRLETLSAIAGALGVDVVDFLAGE